MKLIQIGMSHNYIFISVHINMNEKTDSRNDSTIFISAFFFNSGQRLSKRYTAPHEVFSVLRMSIQFEREKGPVLMGSKQETTKLF